MYQYGQYCPVAMAVEILGDRWTLLIVRDMLTGTRHFNDLVRGLPGISRGLLSERLDRLQRAGLVEKLEETEGRHTTRYELTRAGRELDDVIEALLVWGARWAFEEPRPEDLDPVLILWWMRNSVCVDALPEQRVVVQIHFTGAVDVTHWLLLQPDDVSVCITHPGYEIDVLVTADISVLYQVWLGRMAYADAHRAGKIEVDAIPTYIRGFPTWFTYSVAAPVVRAVQRQGI